MKKLFLILFGFILLLSGCSTASAASYSEENLIPADQMDEFYANPDDFEGQSIAISGQVFQEIGEDGSSVDFQMYGNPAELDNPVLISVPSELATDIAEDDYVKITGVVTGSASGENSMGATLTVPSIQVATIEKTDYMNAVVPAITTTEIDETKTSNGITVTIDKVEFATTETRVYATVKNETGEDLSMPTYETVMIGDSSQYVEQSNYDGDYPEFDSSIANGVEQSAIITLEAIDLESETSLELTMPFYIYGGVGDVDFTFTIK